MSRALSLGEFGPRLTSLARFEDPPFLAVAVSGGPDSLALTLLAHGWARDRGGKICALTVDHRLRPESGAEIRQLGAWLAARGIPHEVLVWPGRKPQTGIQEAARLARYRLLAGWCKAHGCLHLLTAHHREDQIETHLIRRRAHSGADGLAGMSAIRELDGCRVLRPLLDTPKCRLSALLEAEGQPFITDPSNFDPAFERSRYRRADGSAEGFAAAPEVASQIRSFAFARIERERGANELLARCISLHPAGFALVDLRGLLAAPLDAAERVLSALVTAIGGARYPPRRQRIAWLRATLDSAKPRGHTVGGSQFVRWRGRVLVMRELARAASAVIVKPGDELIWDGRFDVGTPQGAGRMFTVGYLGSAGVARLNRAAPRLSKELLPRLIFPILPAIWDEDGIAAVPHVGYRRKGVHDVPQVVFRPVNPLTQAGFAVV